MDYFNINQIEKLTDIKAHTLRIWERRYNFVIPERTDTNIRYYTNQHLKSLLVAKLLLENHYKIGDIAKMSDKEINEVTKRLAISDEPEYEIVSLIEAMLELDEEKIDNILDKSILRTGLYSTLTNIIYPFLNKIGILWTGDNLLPIQEHFITYIIRQKIISAINAASHKINKKSSVSFFLSEDDFHELGLLVAQYIVKANGYKTYYFGQSVPIADIADFISEKTNHIVVLSLSINLNIDYINSVITLAQNNPEINFIINTSYDIENNAPNVFVIHEVEKFLHLFDSGYFE